MILCLISITFGMIILISLAIISMIDDQEAKTVLKHKIGRKIPKSNPFKERFCDFLNMVKVPDPINQIVDKKKVIWSGIQLTHHQFVTLWWLLSLLSVFLASIVVMHCYGDLRMTLLLTVAVILVVLGPNLYLRHRILSRKRAIERSLADFLDMLTLNIEAGLGFLPALARIKRGMVGVLREELGRVLVQMELGLSRQEALRKFANRVPSPDVAHFVEAVILSEKLGTSLTRTIRVQADMLRNRRRHRAEIQGRTAPIRIIPALVFFFLPGLLLIFLAPPIINILFR